MKKIAISIVGLIIGALFLSQFTSCEKYILPEVYFEPDTLHFDYQESTKPVTLHSNVIWKIELDDDAQEWMKLSNSGDTSGCVIDVTVKENIGAKRTKILTVETEAIKKNLTIIQEPKPEEIE